MAAFLNSPLLHPGFIWVHLDSEIADAYPLTYIVFRLGGYGVLGKIDPTVPNGWTPIPYDQYPKVIFQ